MENRGYFRLASFCLLLCLFVTNADANDIADAIGDRQWNNASDSQLEREIGKIETNLSTNGIPISDKPGCLSYCVKRAVDGAIDPAKRINVIWKILDDPRVTFSGEPSAGRGSTPRDRDFVWEPTKMFNTTNLFAGNDQKCELHIEVGCSDARSEALPLPQEYANRDEVSLATMDLAEGYTDTEFTVSEVTEELRILALGKLSQAILEIPAANRAGDAGTNDAGTPRATLSLSRTDDGTGMRLDARNPPAGGWRLKLFGVANSNYSFSVVAASTKAVSEGVDVFATATTQPKESARPNVTSSTSSRPTHLKLGDDNAGTIKSDDQQTLGGQFAAGKQSADEPHVLEFSQSNDPSFVQSEARELMEKKFVRKFARAANLEVETMKSQASDKIVSRGSSDEDRPSETAKIVEDAELEELSRSAEEVPTRTRKTVVELSPNAQLIAKPPFHDVVFTVTNNQPLGIRHAFQGSSTVFPFVGILPTNALWIKSGETIQVAVRVQVPDIQNSSPSIVTLYVGGNENFEVAKKSTYLYAQGANGLTTTDTDKPSIDYTFNDNCNGKLSRDRCSKSLWSVEVTVKDSDSGLKTVTSLPMGLEPRTEFIAGTKNAVSFYYVSSCCYTTVDVKATDVQGNVYTRTIDVTDWDNLSHGEIAAIVVGALLIILLIILIVLLVVYCVRRRKSHDLSYSQRYGSRTPASTERTNF